jgi:hypothetical protein
MQERNPEAGWWTGQSDHVEREVLTTLASNVRLGKAYEQVDGNWRERDTRFPREFVAYEDSFCGVGELCSLIEQLVTDAHWANRSLVQGPVAHHVKITTPFRRIRSNFRDAPRRTWILDFDGVPLPDRFRPSAMPEERWVSDQFTDICNWLFKDVLPDPFKDAGAVFYATSKCGLVQRDTINVRAIVLLEKARTLAEQRMATAWLNARMRERSSECARMEKPPLDETIYTPERLVFTARPRLIGGKEDPIQNPVVAALDDRLLDLPEDVFNAARSTRAASYASTPRSGHQGLTVVGPRKKGEGSPGNLQTAGVETLLSLVTDGETFQPVFNCVLGVLHQTTERNWDEKLEELRIDLGRRFQEISLSPDKLRERNDRYLSDERWSGIVRRARAVVLKGLQCSTEVSSTDPEQLVHGHLPVEDAVDVLRKEVRSWIATVKANTGKMVKKTPRVLLNATTGLGKSRLTIKELVSDATFLRDHRVEYLVSTDKLSGELLEYAQSLPDAPLDLVRQHRGRNQEGMCRSEEFGPLATQCEALGLSPIEAVCNRCDNRTDCKWYAQHEDVTRPGLVFSTHANLGARIAHRKVRQHAENRVHILDESPFNEAFETHVIEAKDIEPSGHFKAMLSAAFRKGESGQQSPDLGSALGHSRQLLRALLASAASTEIGRIDTNEARKALDDLHGSDPIDLEETSIRATRQRLHSLLEDQVTQAG